MWRLALGVLRAQKSQAVVLFLLSVLVMAATAAAPLYADVARDQLRRTELSGASAVERSVTARGAVLIEDNGDGGRIADIQDPLHAAVEGTGLTDLLTLDIAAATAVTTAAWPPVPSVRAYLSARDDVCAHLVLTGLCAANDGEVVIGESAAKALGLTTGSTLPVRISGSAATVELPLRVVGVYRPRDSAEPYWAGRPDVTPDPRRTDTPLFTTRQTIIGLGASTVSLTVDLVALDADVLVADSDPLRETLAQIRRSAPQTFTVSTLLPSLLDRLDDSEQALIVGITAGAAQLIVICAFVLLLAIGFAAAERRTESALAAVRGAPARHRLLLILGPTMLVLLAAAPVGFGLGWLAITAGSRLAFGDAAPVRVSGSSLAVSGVIIALILVAGLLSELRVHAVPLLEALRRTPPRRRRWFLDPIDLIITALAAGAVYQVAGVSQQGDPVGGVGALAPVLLALACGLLAGRLVMPAAVAIGAAQLRRGRLGIGLAAMHLARRAHAHRVLALITIAVAMFGQSVAEVDSTTVAMRERARMELGAERVLTVVGATYGKVRSAVHQADPEGRWAMAVARDDSAGVPMVAVEADRLAAVASWPSVPGTPAVADVARQLRPASNPAVRFDGSALLLDVTVAETMGAKAGIRARLVSEAGDPIDAAFEVGPEAGRKTYRTEVAGCAAGCRLAWFRFFSSAEGIALQGLAQEGPDRVLIDGAGMSSPGRWRTGFTTGDAELRVVVGDTWLSMVYRPSDPKTITDDLRVLSADAPVPIPVAVAGRPEAVDTDEVTDLALLRSGRRPVRVVSAAAGLPGVGDDGYLVDHEYADRLGGDPFGSAVSQVWLAPDAPQAVLDALRGKLNVLSEETVAGRATQLLTGGPGQSARVHLLTSLLGLLLAAVGVVLIATAERRRRAAELLALRVQGMAARPGALSGLAGYVGLVAGGVVFGTLATLPAWWATRTALPVFVDGWSATQAPGGPRGWVAVPALLGVAALLLCVAVLVSRRLSAVVRDGARPGGASVRLEQAVPGPEVPGSDTMAEQGAR